MKARIRVGAGFTIALIFLCLPFTTLAADQTIGSLTVLPYNLNIDKGIMGGLSTARQPVTSGQKIAQEVAVLASFAVIDYTQSVAMFYGSGQYHELNPMLGSKPSRQSMALFGLVGLGVFYLVAKYIPEPWRQVALDSVIASERMNIEDNRRIYQGWSAGGPPIRGRSFNGVPIVISVRL